MKKVISIVVSVVFVISKSAQSENLWNFLSLQWKDNFSVSYSYIWTESINRQAGRMKTRSWWQNVIVKTSPLQLTFLRTENWGGMHTLYKRFQQSQSFKDENNVRDNAWGRNKRKETTRKSNSKKERRNRRSANFDAITGFMSFLPFGGFHFQSGLPELVIQTRPRNERCHRRRRRRRRLPLLPADPFSARNSRQDSLPFGVWPFFPLSASFMSR